MKIPRAIQQLAPDGHLTPALRRRIIIDICRRRIKPGTGIWDNTNTQPSISSEFRPGQIMQHFSFYKTIDLKPNTPI